jgi:hypothetical protein
VRSRCPHSLRERHDATGSIATRCGLRERPPRSFARYASRFPGGLSRGFFQGSEAGARRKCVLNQDGRCRHVHGSRACANVTVRCVCFHQGFIMHRCVHTVSLKRVMMKGFAIVTGLTQISVAMTTERRDPRVEGCRAWRRRRAGAGGAECGVRRRQADARIDAARRLPARASLHITPIKTLDCETAVAKPTFIFRLL